MTSVPGTADDPTNRTLPELLLRNARNHPDRIKRYRVLSREWGPDTGELTPSLKLRRRVVVDRYGSELDALYQD